MKSFKSTPSQANGNGNNIPMSNNNSSIPQPSPEIESKVIELKNKIIQLNNHHDEIIIDGALDNKSSRLSRKFSPIVQLVMDNKITAAYVVSSLLSTEDQSQKNPSPKPTVWSHVVGLELVNTLWLWGTQVNMKEDQIRWKRLCDLVKAFALADIFVRSPSGAVSAGAPIVPLSVLEERQISSSNGTVMSISAVLITTLEFPLLFGSDVLKMGPRGSSFEDIDAHCETIRKRLMKLNTAMVYKQQKYNLLREETEGYAKLVVVLCNLPVSDSCFDEFCDDVDSKLSEKDVIIGKYIKNVLSLVGQFELDPNRVLDILLDAFEQQPTNLTFITLLKHFPLRNIVHMVGFKFLLYEKQQRLVVGSNVDASMHQSDPKIKSVPASEQAAKNSAKTVPTVVTPIISASAVPISTASQPTTPESLYFLAAVLIMSEVVALDDLLLYLTSSIDQVLPATQQMEQTLRQEVISFGVVSLSSSSTPATVVKALEGLAAAPISLESGSVSGEKKPPPPPLPLPAPPSQTSTAATSAGGAKPPPPAYPPPSSIPASGADSKPLGSAKSRSIADSKEPKDAIISQPTGVAVTPEPAGSRTLDFDALLLNDTHHNVEDFNAYANGNQLIGLVCALLAFRGWTQASYILNLLEEKGVNMLTLMCCFCELKAALIELTKWQLSKLYSSKSYFHHAALAALPKEKESEDRRRVLHLPSQQAQQLSSVDTFPQDICPILSYIGYHVCDSPTLFTQLCRLLKAHIDGKLRENPKTFSSVSSFPSGGDCESVDSVVSLYAHNLLPGLSVRRGNNPFLASQLYSGLSLLPFPLRFSVYEMWRGPKTAKEGVGMKPLELSLAETKALFLARSEFKRLAKENTVVIGRKLTKCTQACPLVVYNHVLNQIESFDNLIPFAVEALKYSSDLSRDAMAYCLVSQLKAKSDHKMKEGDTNYSQWFASLSKFIGVYYGRYPSTELKGLLFYLLRSFSEGQSLDLLVLKDLLVLMGGCDTLLDVSQVQLEGLSAGKALRAEVMMMGSGTTAIQGPAAPGARNRKAQSELRAVLLTSRTAIPLLLFIAQIRTRIIAGCSDDGSSSVKREQQLKLVAHLFDTSQEVLMQFTDFLVTAGLPSAGVDVAALSSNNILTATIIDLMPSFPVLIDEVGLSIPVAFQLVRPIMREALILSNNPEVKILPEFLRKWQPLDMPLESLVNGTGSSSGQLPHDLWSLLPSKTYMLFWCLSLYDIKTPSNRYDFETKRLKTRYADLEAKLQQFNKNGASGLTTQDSSGNSQPMTRGEFEKQIKMRQREMNKHLAVLTELSNEQTAQDIHVQSLNENMSLETCSYFHEDSDSQSMLSAIMQYLVYPRVLMSPVDAVYCTQFFLHLHELDTPRFKLLELFDAFFVSLLPLLFCTSEREAGYLGYAFNDLLSTVSPWHTSRELFEVKMQNRVGGHGVSFEQFKEKYLFWHSRLTDVLIFGLSNKEYMYIRSSLIFLSKVSSQFPSQASEGKKLLHLIERLRVQEKQNDRGDLQTMALSLSTLMARNSTAWMRDPSDKDEIVPVEGEGPVARRHSITADRDRDGGRVKERDREKDRDRDGRDKGRDRSEREKERDKDKGRGAERERDRDRDRGDGKDLREKEKLKDVDTVARAERIQAKDKDHRPPAATPLPSSALSTNNSNSDLPRDTKVREETEGGAPSALFTAAGKRKLMEQGRTDEDPNNGSHKSVRRVDSVDNLKMRAAASIARSHGSTVNSVSSKITVVNPTSASGSVVVNAPTSTATPDVVSIDEIDGVENRRDRGDPKEHKKDKDKDHKKDKDRLKSKEKDSKNREKTSKDSRDASKTPASAVKHKVGESDPVNPAPGLVAMTAVTIPKAFNDGEVKEDDRELDGSHNKKPRREDNKPQSGAIIAPLSIASLRASASSTSIGINQVQIPPLRSSYNQQHQQQQQQQQLSAQHNQNRVARASSSDENRSDSNFTSGVNGGSVFRNINSSHALSQHPRPIATSSRERSYSTNGRGMDQDSQYSSQQHHLNGGPGVAVKSLFRGQGSVQQQQQSFSGGRRQR